MRVKIELSELSKLLDDYYIMFNDTFPTYQLGLDEAKIKECLKQGKTAYELGMLELDDNNW